MRVSHVKGRQRQAASDRNDALISSLLDASEKALSAYDIIEALHPHGISSPPTVYRSLARLVAKGQAHRVESLNALSPARAIRTGTTSKLSFAICNACGTVTEFNDSEVAQRSGPGPRSIPFKIEHTAPGIESSCSRCADAGSPHTRK